ncbi:MAG: glycosyltransferase [Bacillota bacterium]
MNKWIEQALAYQSENNLELSVKCYARALEEDPDDKDVLYFAGLFLFNRRRYEEALDTFIRCYEHESQTEEMKQEILANVLAAYYEPNLPEFKKTYERNVQNLLAYEHSYLNSFSAFEDLPCICIPRNDYSYYIFDKETKRFRGHLLVQENICRHNDIASNDCIIAVNLFDLRQLQVLHEQTYQPLMNGMKVPIYLIWADKWKMQIYLQIADYEPVIATKRFVFWPGYKGESGIMPFFQDHQSIIPAKLVTNGQQEKEIQLLLEEAIQFRTQDYADKLSRVRELAENHSEEYYRKLFLDRKNQVRVLFITCRFTTVLQYSIRDCTAACRELGIECDLLIEKSDIHRAFPGSWLEKIFEFKPDVIFQIDHFKWEYSVVPQDYIYVTWVQDPLPHIFSNDSAAKLHWNDFVLVMAKAFRDDLIKLGYPEDNMLHQPMPVNPSIYYKRNVPVAEKKHYGADITAVSHVGDPEGKLAELFACYAGRYCGNHSKDDLLQFFKIAYEITYGGIEKSEPVFTVEDYKKVLREAAGRCGVKLEITEDLAYEFGFQVGNRLHRFIPLTWLAEHNHSLKIWGKEWVSNKKLRNYAMGPAENGEELAKVLSCSKIALGLQPYTTMHPRVLEAMACGCLYLCRFIPEEHDYDSIRNYFVENEDFVFFYDKDDLLRKVDFYLKNEKERERIAENGRRKTVENYTYKKAMQNCLSFIRTALERRMNSNAKPREGKGYVSRA